jgi:hypothetical protein
MPQQTAPNEPMQNGTPPPLPPAVEPALRFAIFAALLGFGLIFIAIAAPMIDPQMNSFRWVIIAVGLAILMGAIGAQVVVQMKWVSAAGAAAMVLIFAWVFKPEPPPPPVAIVHGYLRGTEELPGLVLRTDEGFLLSGRLTPDGFYHFMARGQDIRGRFVVVQARNRQDRLPRDIVINCIPVSLLRESIARTGDLDLELVEDERDAERQRWLVRRTGSAETIAASGNRRCPADGRPLEVSALPSRLWELLVRSAVAQGSREAADIVLGLSNSALDRQARAQLQLSRLRDPATIAAVIDAWSPTGSTEDMEAGLLLGLVNGIRSNRVVAVQILTALTGGQLARLVELTGSRDRTIRYNATELLSWMLQSSGWPNPAPEPQVRLLLQVTLDPFRDPGRYFSERARRGVGEPANIAFNTLVALNDAKCIMRIEDRAATRMVLRDFTLLPTVRDGDFVRTVAAAQRFAQEQCPG